jgi:FKBP-type peptidyl-prolyl cis-trans isomerase SlyD
VPAEEGYGERQGPGAQRVSREAFAGVEDIEVGMAFDTEDEDGELQTVWVVGVEEGDVLIDLNHPLAGEELHFDIEILDVRAATADELHHGHAHGPNGHGHDPN